MSIDDVVDVIIYDITNRWSSFISEMRFKDDIPLAFKIDALALTLEPYCLSEYPFLAGNRGDFWSLYRTAVLRSKTHGYGDVMSAFDEVLKHKDIVKKSAIIAPLDTKIKRLGAIFLAFGGLMFFVGSIYILSNEWYYSNYFDALLGALSISGHDYRQYWLAAYGFYISLVGFLFSYAYDKTIGVLVDWVRSAPK